MRDLPPLGLAWVILALGLLCISTPAQAAEPFPADVAKILKDRCLKCHTAEKSKGGLSLESREAMLKGGDNGPALVPGDPSQSLLIQRIDDVNDTMPPSGLLPDGERAILRAWVKNVPAAPSSAPKEEEIHVRVAELLKTHCASCHTGETLSGGLNITELATLLKGGKTGPAVVPGRADDSILITRIEHASKPMPPKKPLASAERSLLRNWVEKGAPAYAALPAHVKPEPIKPVVPPEPAPDEPIVISPDRIGEEYILRSILEDVRALSNAGRLVENYRYFSLNHLLAQGITRDGLQRQRDAFTLVLNHLSWQKELFQPEVIEPTNTILRVSLPALGWDAQPYQGADGSTADLTLHDLVLLEYPYGIAPTGLRVYQDLAQSYLRPAKLIRPLPYLKADWFTSVAASPPLYDDLLMFPQTQQEFERLIQADSADSLARFKRKPGSVPIVRAGTVKSGVSRNNRVIERHVPRGGLGYYWLSYDFAGSAREQNLMANPVDLKPAGGEMVVSLPNGLHGYYVSDHTGRRLDAAPTSIVTDKHASDKTVRNGMSCMRCHDMGIQPAQDNVREMLQGQAGSPGFDLDVARQLYPGRDAVNEWLNKDTDAYMAAVSKLFPGRKVTGQVLQEVTQRFLDRPLTTRMALAELGESNAADTDNRFQSRELIEVGLGSLATPEGTVRRDSWEQAYEAAVRSFNRGQCLLPFDGIARQSDGETPRNFRGRLAEADVEIRFDPAQPVIGLPFLIQIVNNGTRPAFMEVVVTSVEGQIVRATPGVLEVASGKAVKIPIAKVNAKAGRESITVYASHQRFLPGEVLSFNKDGRLGRLGHGMRDRFVHRWLYQLPENSARPIPSADGDPLIKITRDVETRK